MICTLILRKSNGVEVRYEDLNFYYARHIAKRWQKTMRSLGSKSHSWDIRK